LLRAKEENLGRFKVSYYDGQVGLTPYATDFLQDPSQNRSQRIVHWDKWSVSINYITTGCVLNVCKSNTDGAAGQQIIITDGNKNILRCQMNAVLLPITISLEENLWWLISFKLRLSLSISLFHKYPLYRMSATAHVGKISTTRKVTRNNQPIERWGMRAGNQLFSFVHNCISKGTLYVIFRQ